VPAAAMSTKHISTICYIIAQTKPFFFSLAVLFLFRCLHKRSKSLPLCVASVASIERRSPQFMTFSYYSTGNGLIDETEFLQWIGRIQALREETTSPDDDLTQDLVAAFR